MPPIPRTYQQKGIDIAVDFFHDHKKKYNGIEILPTGSGKSVVIANIAKELDGKTVVFQPSKEILEQNVKKFLSYGYRCGVYSASAGMKYVDNITFATIGSVAKKQHIFNSFKNIIVDECHLVNPTEGMYHKFIRSFEKVKVLGLTATPYRLTSSFDGAMLKFITRQTPRMFNKVLYYVQNDELFNAGHLAKLRYFNFDVIDREKLSMNSTGSDFTEASVRAYNRQVNMAKTITEYANRILAKRKNLLVFCSLIEEAYKVSAGVPGSVVITGDTDKAVREKILSQFTKGIIKCVINVGVLTTGFDYPELEATLIGRSTMSLALYYQMGGRIMRPHPLKEDAWLVDLGGNLKMFGKFETMKIVVDSKGLYSVWNNGRQLTNVPFSKN